MVTKIDETQAAPMGFGQRWIRFDGSVLNAFDDLRGTAAAIRLYARPQHLLA